MPLTGEFQSKAARRSLAHHWPVRRQTLHASTMARKILWVDEATIPLARLRDIGQT